LQGGFFLGEQAATGHRRNDESEKRDEVVLRDFQSICQIIRKFKKPLAPLF